MHMSYNDVFYSEYSNCVAIVHKETIYGSSLHKIQVAMTSYNQTKNKKKNFLVIVADFTELEK